MAKLSIAKGSTSVLVRIFMSDSSSTTGAGLTGLAFNTAGLTCYRMRDDDGNAGATAISLATATKGTWTSGGFVEKDATNAPGWYEFGIPNAALATGSRSVDFHFKGATNLAPLPIEVDLAAQVDVTSWNGTAVSNPATAGVPDINVKNINNVSASAVTTIKAVQGLAVDGVITTVTNQLTAAQIATGIWTDTVAGDFTTALSIGKSVMNGVTLGTGLTVARCTLTDTLTTYTANTPQTGDSFARIGATGSALTSLATPTNITAGTVTLLSTGLDAVLVESGISATAALTNDAGAQLTSINARQALALSISTLGGLLSGAGTTSVAIKPGGNASGNTRVVATVDASGNRTASNIKVPT